ncbi:hypothetical protein Taro_013712 [Colocasia esculenta]|uniref:Uncharacterized protein n=1 Tax=Colocasia esculenta TaxID=4460 RepID=A0A843UCG2_COLES|nr:hypothetical protein [Colocasia esculenta]
MKVIFFPCSSATTCANCPFGVEQRYKHCMDRTTLSSDFLHFRSAPSNASGPEDAFQASGIMTLVGDVIL